MREQLTKLVRHTAVYGVGRMASKVISFLLIPFYTHYFATTEYGVMEILNLAAMIAGIALAPGLSNAAMRFYYETEDEGERNSTISTALIFSLVVGAAAAFLMTVYSAPIASILLGKSQYAILVSLVALGFFFSLFSDICLVYLRSKQKSGLYVLLTQGFLTLCIALNIYFVAARKLGVKGVFLSNAIAGAIFGGTLLWLTTRHVGLHFSVKKLAAMLRFGAPLILTWLAAFVLNFSDRFFLQRYSDLSHVGVYSVAYKFGYIVSLAVVQPFNLGWEPQAYEIAKQENGQAMFARIFSLYSALLVTTAFMMSLFIQEVFSVMVDAKFFLAYALVPLIAFAYVCQGIQGFVEAGLLITKKTRLIGLIGLWCTVLCLLLNLVFIHLWTMWGACIATFMSMLAMAAVTYWYSERAYPTGCNLWPLVKTTALAGVLLLCTLLIPIDAAVTRVIIKIAFVAIYVSGMLKFGLIPRQDVTEMRAVVAEWAHNRLAVAQGWLNTLYRSE